MKFSEISKEKWEELSPYLDTCMLPVTGMTGNESPYEATEMLESLRDIMDLVEIPFKGRVVTYPAWHYVTDKDQFMQMLNDWCIKIKKSGFRYIIVVTSNRNLSFACPAADLVFTPDEEGTHPNSADLSNAIRTLWSGQAI
ncbi:hypothetical protein FHS15_002759 [Paenibacillus castaneae]|uniref:DUF2487 family protein n=1 Tax=Paenibacillus castaneae TaxID=474957 RepID=UPI000C9C64FB|nr:DUF2487 family protein [Paenibacillus castaneae]NIK77623.1 hypothetical protein [Paenibacillus castaneae]